MAPQPNRKPEPPQPPRGDGGPDGSGSPRPPRRFPMLLLLVLALLLPLLMQSFGQVGPVDSIRYDELRRYVREGRVEWVHLTASEIRGKYVEGKKPSLPPGSEHEERPDRFETGRVEDDKLVDLLEEHGVAFRQVEESNWGEQWPWLLYIGVTIAFMALLWGGLFRRMGAQAGGVLSFGKSRGKVFQENEVKVTFEDVAGVDEAKEELQEVIEFLKNPDKYQRIGAKIPKGLLLVGPPGTGKTLLARAVAGEAQVPFISISGSEFVEMFVGVGAARVRDLFEQANRSAPCIVFIDELDALGRSRGGAALGGGSNEEREQTLNQLLVELDGFEPHQAVIIMAATNRPEILDPALLRPGRFDRQVLVDRPDRRGRERILQVHVRHLKLGDDVDLSVLAARTPGFAGADLANMANEAALLAARRGREQVTMADFSDAIDRVIAGLEKKSRIITDEERKRVAFHEVGHALAGTLSGADDTVHKISIVPRGMAALGYTMQLPTEERYLMTESAIRAKLVGLLGGRAAEELVFGETSTGAQDDLRKATDIARAMVTEYGMSAAIGPVSVSSERRPLFLQGREGGAGGFSMGRDVGDRLADTVDAEVRRIVDEAREKAMKLLEENRDVLDDLATHLLEAEVLEGDELRKLLDGAKKRHAKRHPEAAAAE
ncbi:MAG: ATP-dependent zinc metalloprotease FtsH [Myxococcota bacterium]